MNMIGKSSKAGDKIKSHRPKEGIWHNLISPILQALIIVIFARTLIVQPFSIPSGSMISTLLIGDNIFASKYSYGYSRYSFPVDLGFNGRILRSAPERGDVIVFRLPSDPSIDYVKRLVGLPGDRIQLREGVLYLNGKRIDRKAVEPFFDDVYSNQVRGVRQFQETMPNGVTYNTLDTIIGSPMDNTGVYIVPDGEYFFMGDNRDNSKDSRYSWEIGTVPEQNLVGKAQFVFFSMKEGSSFWQFWLWPWSIRWSRLFSAVE